MKILYLECKMGAAGDMLTAALSELHPDAAGFERRFNSLNIPDVTLALEKSKKCGIAGTHAHVTVNGREEGHHHHNGHDGHHHRSMADIEHIISHLAVNETVRENAIGVYRLIAEAESHAHGTEVSEIHFHEVGTMDAIADVVAVCMLMDEIKPDKIIASPVHVGSGHVRCAHGILPVPAPATAYILRGVPIYGGDIDGELCTPTGAALLKYFAEDFTSMPVIRTEKIGYGMGNKDFERTNCVRAVLGHTADSASGVTELRCNIDDMTGEMIGFAVETLLNAGALDVYTIPVSAKKNRPGILLTVMCRASQKDEMLRLMFRHTTTLGIRGYTPERYTLERRAVTLETNYGAVSGKCSRGCGTVTVKPEYEEIARIARENDVPIKEIKIKEEF